MQTGGRCSVAGEREAQPNRRGRDGSSWREKVVCGWGETAAVLAVGRDVYLIWGGLAEWGGVACLNERVRGLVFGKISGEVLLAWRTRERLGLWEDFRLGWGERCSGVVEERPGGCRELPSGGWGREMVPWTGVRDVWLTEGYRLLAMKIIEFPDRKIMINIIYVKSSENVVTASDSS